MGIYNGFYTVSPDILPSQTVPLKDKLEKPKTENGEKSWSQRCLDALETIGKAQFNININLIENYEMIKGRFIFNHYFQTEGYDSMLGQLSAEMELPNYLRHYDIIGQVINTMSGEWQKRPDVFKIRQVGDEAANEYLRTKKELTQQYVFSKIDQEINSRLAAQGIDANKQDFATEEEQQLYFEEIQQIKQQMTPVDIQKYMDVDFLTYAEIWANNQKEQDREYFNLAEKEKTEFEDMLVADRCFRHFHLTATGYNQETWNPVNTFFHKSPDTVYIEDGDYVGRIFNLSANTIIDRYGYLMSKEEMDILKGEHDEDNDKHWNDHKYNWVYNNYLMPFAGYPDYDIMRQSWNVPPTNNIPQLDSSFFSGLQDNLFYREREGFYFVVEAYWKTQKKIIKLTYRDPETGDTIVRLVDELYQIPKHFKESNRIFDDEHENDTYCETYVNEVWKGIKINTGVDKSAKRDIYLAIGPNDFQFKGDLNRYNCKLPVCGQVFSIRNSRSMSLVDLMKPYQIAYNVAMNQIYQLMEKEIGMFVVMDVNMFPNSKDWGGSDSWDKWMLMAKNLGMLPADTSPDNIKNSMAVAGGFLPKVLDLNLAGQMVSRVNLCKFFEEQALKQIGFNQYRTGSFSSSTTATGIQEGMSQSFSQTESYFTNFSNYLRRCLQMSLDISQFVQSQKEDILILNSKSDYSRGFIKILGTDLLLADLNVLVSNSQEHIRQLEMIRQYALQNNTAGMSPVEVAKVITMNSPQEIIKQLEVGLARAMQQEDQARQMQQQALEQQGAIEQADLQEKARQFDELMENNLDRERIKAGVAVITSNEDVPTPPIDNTFDQQLALQNAQSDNNLKREQLAAQVQATNTQDELKARELALKAAKINADIQIQNQETNTARILKGRDMP